MKGCVIDAFDGLNVLSDNEFNPKNKHNATKANNPHTGANVGRDKAGIDKRFSALPLESTMV